jgi:hypothetical protein
LSHCFQYDDLPFIDAKPSTTNYKVISKSKDDVDMGFDFRHEIKDKEQGKYEITYRTIRSATHNNLDFYTGWASRSARHNLDGIDAAWIELFVKKRNHPNFSPRIKILKKRLEEIELVMSSYLEHDLNNLAQLLIEEKNAIQKAIEKKELQTKLREILETRLSQHQKRMKILRGCILGYQAHVKGGRRELVRQRSRYTMLEKLTEVTGVNQFVQTFLGDCTAYFKQENITQLSIVWGRKQAPNQQPDYQVQSAKIKGDAIGAFFKRCDKPRSEWLGKIYRRCSYSQESASSIRRESSRESVKEKIAADFYDYLSDGKYIIPKTRLAELPIKNKFTKEHGFTEILLEDINKGRQEKINEGVYVMSKYVEDYQDLADLNSCILGDKLLNFEQCLEQGRLPQYVMIENKKVPLKGVMEILAVSRLLADTDVLGGSAKNSGFLIERNIEGQPIAARAVKVDPGFAFNFEGSENLLFQSYNPQGTSNNLLRQDKRHLQYGNLPKPLLWSDLTDLQRDQFILALEYGLKMLRDNDEVIKKFFTRNSFEKTPKQRDLPKVEQYLNGLQKNLDLQEDVYKQELEVLREQQSYSTSFCY